MLHVHHSRLDLKTRINRYMEGAMRDWKKGLSEAH